VDSVPSLGQLVFSRAGRDHGRPMVVVGVVDARHVLVADGDLRKTTRPKRKNIRHLAGAAPVLPGVEKGQVPGDAAVRAWLQEVAGGTGEEDGR
jgi:large subunit ribosomal protein L14e